MSFPSRLQQRMSLFSGLLWLALGSQLLHVKSMTYLVAQTKDTHASCQNNLKCISFATLIKNSTQYIASHSIIKFYPGLYSKKTTSLDPGTYQIEISGLDNVTIRTVEDQDFGTLRARISCTTEFKFTWSITYSKNIKLLNLEMTECSVPVTSPLFDLKNFYLQSPRLNFTTTIQVFQTTNITFTNLHAYSVEQSVLLCFNIRENLYILNSTFQGSIEIKSFPSHKQVRIYIGESIMIPGLYFKFTKNEHEHQKGITIKLRKDVSSKIKIINSILKGAKKLFGDLITVKNEKPSCPTFIFEAYNSSFNNGGINLGGCLLNNCLLMKNCTISKIPKNTRFYLSKVAFEISNTAILESEEGLTLIKSSGKISNSKFAYNKNALIVEDSSVTIRGEVYFSNNIQGEDGISAMLLKDSVVRFEGHTVVENTRGGKYGAVISSSTTLHFYGETHFTRNEGFHGGALSLYDHSIMNIHSTATVLFTNNHAWRSGGAIYVDTNSYRHPKTTHNFYSVALDQDYQCFFYSLRSLKSYGSIEFCNNTSVEGGHSIYGGSVNRCYLKKSTSEAEDIIVSLNISLSVFLRITTFCENTTTTLSKVSSLPYYLCFCEPRNNRCSQINRNISMAPGQTIEVSVIAVGQLEGATLATVQARLMIPYEKRLNPYQPYISQSQARQLLGISCNRVQYTVHAQVGTETLVLATNELAEEDVHSSLIEFREFKYKRNKIYATGEVPLLVHITLRPCSLGYIYNTETLSCECHPYISHPEIQCVQNSQTIIRSGTIWVNVTNKTFIMHKHCPMGYCKAEPTEFSLTDPSAQCSFNRTGTLCGRCKEGYSQMLGSFHCRQCSNLWILLIVPLTLLSGVLLVVFLITLDLTVATGTINGLVFYANIIRPNNAIFFGAQTNTITKICNIFIAWINLDLVFEVCFYHGLDAYVKTLYQLAFPLYICTLVGIIIVSSHYSTRAARLFGNNAVQVLATLFLLSYSKSIRLVITALSPTVLTVQYYPEHTSNTKLVWLYDGNVDYLQDKHVALFLLGILILVAVSFPYTATLLFIQCLQRWSHHKCLSWVWKMKPLFDAYTGPYKNNHRYWTGLLLLLRVVLLAVFSLNVAGDPAINLLATAILMLLTLSYLVIAGTVYKSLLLSILECFFLSNLTVLSVSSLFALLTNSGQELITNMSVVLSMMVFGGVIIQHIYKRLKSLMIKKGCVRASRNREPEEEVSLEGIPQECEVNRLATKQVVSIRELEEPLIATEDTQ